MITPKLVTQLRALLEGMDADIGLALADLGLVDYRTRFSAVIRRVDADGPCPIRELADAMGVTHSAASQTVAEMERRGLLELTPGSDARHRLVRLTRRARRLLPAIDAEWDATELASAALEAELPYPLSRLVDELAAALEHRRFRDRIADAAAELPADLDPDIRTALGRRHG